ncbi:MAG: hypothetical protein EA397_08200 [Deltaproteobacteria bacterium]|nr:MAG: hypothetical protein EA397_08200 [Deltaproteobacteria bacterium]
MKSWIREAVVGVVLAAGVVGGLIVWQGYMSRAPEQELTGELADMYRPPKSDRTKACTTLRGSHEERFDACLAELARPRLSKAAKGELQSFAKSGKTLVIGPKLDADADELPLPEELKSLLHATDEKAAAAAVRELGVRAVVVYRDLTQAIDRDATVISRLAQHDHLEWFQLRRVTEQLFIYTVRESPSVVPLSTGTLLLEGLRARLEGRPPPAQSWKPKSSVRLMASARLQGHTLVIRHSVGRNLERVLDELASKVQRQWDRHVAIEGHGILEDRLDDVRLEVHVVMERAQIEPRSAYAIFELFELGVDGFFLRRARGLKPEKFTYVPGSEAVPRAFKSAEAMLRDGVQRFGWNHPRPWEDSRTRFDLMRTSHFMEKRPGGGAGAVRLVRGMPEVKMRDLTDDRIRDMLVAGGEWWLYNLQEDDSFTYKYWPEQNRFSSDYNEVRHLLGVRDLADTWRYRKDPRYLQGSRRAMDWIMRYAVRDTDPPDSRLPHPPAGSMLFRYPFKPGEVPRKPPNQKLGTVAVALLGWVPYARVSGDRSEDENIRAMAKFVLSRLESNGKFDPYYVHRGHSYHNMKNDIVPGEAALALGLVAEYFDEPEWVEFYPKFLDYYEPWFRERAKRVRPTGRWPHGTYTNDDRLDMVQFGPWSVMASAQYYKLTGDERAAAFGLEVSDWMIDNYQWSEERSPFPDFVGGYYKIPTELPAMQTFCYSEGTAAAYRIAAKFKPEAKEKYDVSTREAIRFMGVMQFDETSSYFAARPDLIHGGIKYAMNEQKVRTDYVGHGLSTLSQYLDARAFDPEVELKLTEPSLDELPPAPRRGAPSRASSGASGSDEDGDEEGEDQG